MVRKRKYTKELLSNVVVECVSLAGVLRKLGMKQTGGTQGLIKKRIEEYEIDTSHFFGQSANRGKHHCGGPGKKKWDEVLVLRISDRREKSVRLRRALIDMGREYRCENPRCKVKGKWIGETIILHVHHENGNFMDCRPGNLRFKCPNCHSMEKNHSNNLGLTDVTSDARSHRKRKSI